MAKNRIQKGRKWDISNGKSDMIDKPSKNMENDNPFIPSSD